MEQQLCDRAIRLSCYSTSKEKFTAAGPRCEATPDDAIRSRRAPQRSQGRHPAALGLLQRGAVGAAGRGGAATPNSMAFHKAMV